MPNIICSIPNPLDATSLYRGLGPMMTLKRQYPNMDLVLNPDLTWMNLKGADFCFFQRPAFPDRLAAMKLAKANGKLIWADYDDNLHAGPVFNRRYRLYGDPQTQHNVSTMVAMADVVTVTTEHLANTLRAILKAFPSTGGFVSNPDKIQIIPNAYDSEIMPALTETRAPREKLVMWRGSDSHSKDLWIHTEAIANVILRNSDWHYEFAGEPFWLAIDEFKKVAGPQGLTVTAPQDPVTFFKYMHTKKPAVVIVPLEDISFNHSKSNIAWIEATTAGAVTIAPDWAEWRRPGIINYRNVDELDSIIEGALNTDLENRWRQSRDYILEHLQLRNLNKARYAIVEKLMAQSQSGHSHA